MLCLLASLASAASYFCFKPSGSSVKCPEGSTAISTMDQFDLTEAQNGLRLFLANSASTICKYDWSKIPNGTSISIMNGFVDLTGMKENITLSLTDLNVTLTSKLLNVSVLSIYHIEFTSKPDGLTVYGNYFTADLRSLSYIDVVKTGRETTLDISEPNYLPKKSFEIELGNITLMGASVWTLIGAATDAEVNFGLKGDIITFPKENITVAVKKVPLASSTVYLDLENPAHEVKTSFENGIEANQVPVICIEMKNGTIFKVPELPSYVSVQRFFFNITGDATVWMGSSSYCCYFANIENSKLDIVLHDSNSITISSIRAYGDTIINISSVFAGEVFTMIHSMSFSEYKAAQFICQQKDVHITVNEMTLNSTLDDPEFLCDTQTAVKFDGGLSYGAGDSIFAFAAFGLFTEITYYLSLERVGIISFLDFEKSGFPINVIVSYTGTEVPSNELVEPYIYNTTYFFHAPDFAIDDIQIRLDPFVKVDGFAPGSNLLQFWYSKSSGGFAYQMIDYPSRLSPIFILSESQSETSKYININGSTFYTWRNWVSNVTQFVGVVVGDPYRGLNMDFRNYYFDDASLIILSSQYILPYTIGLREKQFRIIELTAVTVDLLGDHPVLDCEKLTLNAWAGISNETIAKLDCRVGTAVADVSTIENLQMFYNGSITIDRGSPVEDINVTLVSADEWLISDDYSEASVRPGDNLEVVLRARTTSIIHEEGETCKSMKVVWPEANSTETLDFMGTWEDGCVVKATGYSPTPVTVRSETGTIPLELTVTQSSMSIIVDHDEDMVFSAPIRGYGQELRIATLNSTSEIRITDLELGDYVGSYIHEFNFTGGNIHVDKATFVPGHSTVDGGCFHGSINVRTDAYAQLCTSKVGSAVVTVDCKNDKCGTFDMCDFSAVPKQILINAVNVTVGSKRVVSGVGDKCEEIKGITSLVDKNVYLNGELHNAFFECMEVGETPGDVIVMTIEKVVQKSGNVTLIISLSAASCVIVGVVIGLAIAIGCKKKPLPVTETRDEGTSSEVLTMKLYHGEDE